MKKLMSAIVLVADIKAVSYHPSNSTNIKGESNMESNELHARLQTVSEDVSEQKSQATPLSDDEFLSDEELAAVSGGTMPFDGDFIRAIGEIAGGIGKAGESVGRTIGRTFWNGDRY
jgi:hypothetical protein